MNQLISTIEPSPTLKKSILNKIKVEETKRTVYKIVISSAVSLASVFTTIFSIINIIKDAAQSGLSEYLSLLSSDGALIASFWQTYVMSVAESLPIIPITIVVASVWIFAWSLNSVLQLFRETELVRKLKV